MLRGCMLPAPCFRLAPLDSRLENVYGYRHLQTFFPGLSKLHKLSKKHSSNVWLDSKWRISAIDSSGCAGPCTVHLIPNTDSSGTPITGTPVATPAFLKVTHLLDPVEWMQGSYSLPKESGLPSHGKSWKAAWNKLQDPWNQAYVESICSYALGRLREEDWSPHFNMFYGAFCARADTYMYNLTDEFGTFRTSRKFWSGIDKELFSLKVVNTANRDLPVPPNILEEILERPSDSELDSESEGESESDSISEEELEVDSSDLKDLTLDAVSVHSGAVSELSFDESIPDLEELSDDSEESDDEEDEYSIYAVFKDFPVMLIAMEENRGTLDSLLDKPEEVGANPGTEDWELRWSAWLFQVIAGLSAAQRLFGFTHNDLHTNNIVWTETKEEFLYYTLQSGAVFKVPTFGKLFRLIDFGRAILTINGQQFISDDFRPGNDAAEQYSFKPLHSNPVNEVPPNPSFDLCRLAVSLLDAVFPERPAVKEGGRVLNTEKGHGDYMETVSHLYNSLWTWMIDDEGRNVLVNPDESERFPDFDLYKHIAAKIHNAIPSQQFTNPAFDRFQVNPSDVEASVKRWSLFV